MNTLDVGQVEIIKPVMQCCFFTIPMISSSDFGNVHVLNLRDDSVTEPVMISSDEEEGGGDTPTKSSNLSAPCTPSSNQSRSPSHSEHSDCPESPFIPNIPITQRPEIGRGRVCKMEGRVSASYLPFVCSIGK